MTQVYALAVSIWTRNVFGRAAAPTPASAVAVRCTLIRASTGWAVLPAVIVGAILGRALAVVCLMLAAITQGPAPLPFWEAVGTFLKGFGLKPWLMAGGTLVFVWWVLPWVGTRAFRGAAGLTREKTHQSRKLRRMSRRILVAMLLVLFGLAITSSIQSRSAMLFAVGTLSAYVGGPLLAYGLVRRKGAALVCARCQYPMGSWRGAPAMCPECGGLWKEPWNAHAGRHSPSLPAISGGAVLVVLCIALFALLRATP